jgi:ABC-2 type transport system ATP-binding protein
MSVITDIETVISVRGVVKKFKDIVAVNGVDLSIQPGEFVALLGPNGAGKTTLVEMIEGIQRPDEGEILIQNKPWKGNESKLNRVIGLSLQETHFIDNQTVYETLKLFASFFGLKASRVNEIVDLVDLGQKRKSFVKHLSGGQKQRLALGIAILHRPKILLLDEPTTGLDPAARREIWHILLQLKKERGTSLILTSHYMEEAEYLCERIVIMYGGKILAHGTLEKLLADNQCGEIIEFGTEEKINQEFLKSTYTANAITWDDNIGKGHVYVDKIINHLPGFLEYIKLQNLHLSSLECRKKTLDDLFISLTGRRLEE